MTYALVENGSVVETFADLPVSWKNVSGLNRLAGDAAALAELGWYEVTYPEVDYDPDTQMKVVTGYVVDSESVTAVESVVQLPDRSEVVMAEIRSFRDAYLRETDWTQLADTLSKMSAEKIVEWQDYRQSLRDMPQTYASATKLSDVVWPTRPQ